MSIKGNHPAWRVTLDGADLTSRMAPRLVELTLTECRGGEADQLDLVIHDHDGRMDLPKRGVLLQVAIGWRDSALVEKGTFQVDEVEHQGAPDTITIRARSTDLTHKIRSRRERSWHEVTLGDVVRAIAGEHGLQANIAAPLASIAIPHLDQANESDINLLTRLGQRFDAVATVKAGKLIFAPISSGVTASGKTLPDALITRASGDQHRFSTSDRSSYSGVKAYWTDKAGARRKSVTVGDDENAKQLRETYPTAAVAKQHAEAEWKRLQRGTAQFSYTLALGRAEISPEQKIRVQGFKPVIDSEQWLVVKATHSISGGGGFTTALELERAL